MSVNTTRLPIESHEHLIWTMSLESGYGLASELPEADLRIAMPAFTNTIKRLSLAAMISSVTVATTNGATTPANTGNFTYKYNGQTITLPLYPTGCPNWRANQSRIEEPSNPPLSIQNPDLSVVFPKKTGTEIWDGDSVLFGCVGAPDESKAVVVVASGQSTGMSNVYVNAVPADGHNQAGMTLQSEVVVEDSGSKQTVQCNPKESSKGYDCLIGDIPAGSSRTVWLSYNSERPAAKQAIDFTVTSDTRESDAELANNTVRAEFDINPKQLSADKGQIISQIGKNKRSNRFCSYRYFTVRAHSGSPLYGNLVYVRADNFYSYKGSKKERTYRVGMMTAKEPVYIPLRVCKSDIFDKRPSQLSISSTSVNVGNSASKTWQLGRDGKFRLTGWQTN